MAVDYSRNAKVYINTGTYAAPDWNEIKYVKDLSMPFSRDEIDAITRKSGAYKAFLPGHIDSEITFRIQYHGDDPRHAMMRTRCLAGTVAEFAIMNGNIATSDNEGLRAHFYIMGFDFDEAIAGVFEIDVRLKLDDTETPAWYTVP